MVSEGLTQSVIVLLSIIFTKMLIRPKCSFVDSPRLGLACVPSFQCDICKTGFQSTENAWQTRNLCHCCFQNYLRFSSLWTFCWNASLNGRPNSSKCWCTFSNCFSMKSSIRFNSLFRSHDQFTNFQCEKNPKTTSKKQNLMENMVKSSFFWSKSWMNSRWQQSSFSCKWLQCSASFRSSQLRAQTLVHNAHA